MERDQKVAALAQLEAGEVGERRGGRDHELQAVDHYVADQVNPILRDTLATEVLDGVG